MLRFLASLRRFLLAGVVSIACIFILPMLGVDGISFNGSEMIGKIYKWFALLSPALYLVSWIVSVAYIRKKGQFADYHQTQSFGATMKKVLKDDITSPFRLIGRQFVSKKKAMQSYSQVMDPQIARMVAEGSAATIRLRLYRMIVKLAIIVIGVMTAI